MSATILSRSLFFGCKKPKKPWVKKALCPVFTQMAKNFSTWTGFQNLLDINVCCLLLIWRFSRWKRHRTAYRTAGVLMEFKWELQQQSSLTLIDRGFNKINQQDIRFCRDCWTVFKLHIHWIPEISGKPASRLNCCCCFVLIFCKGQGHQAIFFCKMNLLPRIL